MWLLCRLGRGSLALNWCPSSWLHLLQSWQLQTIYIHIWRWLIYIYIYIYDGGWYIGEHTIGLWRVIRWKVFPWSRLWFNTGLLRHHSPLDRCCLRRFRRDPLAGRRKFGFWSLSSAQYSPLHGGSCFECQARQLVGYHPSVLLPYVFIQVVWKPCQKSKYKTGVA